MVCRFSGSANLLALSVFICDRKRGYGGHLDFINFNRSYFQLNALKPGIYRFSGCASLLAFLFVIQNEAMAAIFILSLVFCFWHTVLAAVVSDCVLVLALYLLILWGDAITVLGNETSFEYQYLQLFSLKLNSHG